MSWTTPIYDRTLADITNRTSKGFWNVADWIRVNGNAQYVNTLLRVLRGVNVTFTVLTPPTTATMPTVDDINQFVANIERLRANCGLPDLGQVALTTNYIAGAGSIAPDYQDVNDWERDLDIIKQYSPVASIYAPYTGLATTGMARLWQSRFRSYLVQNAASPIRVARSGISTCGTGLMRKNKWRRY